RQGRVRDSWRVHQKQAAARRRPLSAELGLRHLQIVVLQREGADALPGCLEIGVEHRGCRDADGRLAHATPGGGAARGHDDRLDLDMRLASNQDTMGSRSYYPDSRRWKAVQNVLRFRIDLARISRQVPAFANTR